MTAQRMILASTLRRPLSSLARVGRSRWFVLFVLALLAVFGPQIAPYDPMAIPLALSERSAMPSMSHWAGTDALGRDIASRLLAGSRYTLVVAAGALSIATALGVFVGLLSAISGGRTDRVFMRVVETLASIPRLVLLLAVIGVWGHPSAWFLVVILGTTSWFGLSRLVRVAALGELAEFHVLAARALGATQWRLLRQHLLPAVLALVATWMAIAFGELILLETGLSFLGLGIPAPYPSWGTVLLDTADVFGPARWLVLAPGILIAGVVMLLQRLADDADVAVQHGAL